MAIASLVDYIADPDRRRSLANAVPTQPQYLYQLATEWRGKRASRLMAIAIERETAGHVSRADLRPDIWPSRSEAA